MLGIRGSDVCLSSAGGSLGDLPFRGNIFRSCDVDPEMRAGWSGATLEFQTEPQDIAAASLTAVSVALASAGITAIPVALTVASLWSRRLPALRRPPEESCHRLAASFRQWLEFRR